MSTFWTNAQDIEQCPSLNVDEVAGSSSCLEMVVPIDELLRPNASGSVASFIATYLDSGFHSSANLEGMLVETRNTSQVDNVEASTSSLTRNYSIPVERTSANSNPLDSRMVTSVTFLGENDDLAPTKQISCSNSADSFMTESNSLYSNFEFESSEESSSSCRLLNDRSPSSSAAINQSYRVVTKPITCSNSANSFMTDNNSQYPNFELESASSSYRLLRDRSPSVSAVDQSSNRQYYHGTKFQPYPQTHESFQSLELPRTYDTFIPEQCPIYSSHKITEGSSYTTFAGPRVNSVPAVLYAPSTIQSNFTSTVSHHERSLQRPDSMAFTHPYCLRPEDGIELSSTSQTVNRTKIPCPNIEGEPKLNATGQNRSLVNSTNPHDPNFAERPWVCRAGPKHPGVASEKFSYFTDTGERIYECDSCGSRFQDQNELYCHHRLIRNPCTKSSPLECNICKCIHSGEKPFGCGLCEKEFWHIKDIVGHRRVHLELRPFKCPRCPATFWNKHALDKHVEASITFR